MARWTYKPSGFPYGRFLLTILPMAIIGYTIVRMLHKPEPSQTDYNILFACIGYIAGVLHAGSSWWYKEEGGNGNGHTPSAPSAPPAPEPQKRPLPNLQGEPRETP